jgi:hypothetical protein
MATSTTKTKVKPLTVEDVIQNPVFSDEVREILKAWLKEQPEAPTLTVAERLAVREVVMTCFAEQHPKMQEEVRSAVRMYVPAEVTKPSRLPLIGTLLLVAAFGVLFTLQIGGVKELDTQRVNMLWAALHSLQNEVELSPKPAVPAVVPEPPVDHIIQIDFEGRCWTEITADGAQIVEGVKSGRVAFDATESAQVRSGCPGKVTYRIDDKVVYPVNEAKNSEKVELVNLIAETK